MITPIFDSLSLTPPHFFSWAYCARLGLLLPLRVASIDVHLDNKWVLSVCSGRNETPSSSGASTSAKGKQTSCPLCSRKTWAQQEQDLWRLERWLDHAENQFRSHERIPNSMDQLEDTVQDFRVSNLTHQDHPSDFMAAYLN